MNRYITRGQKPAQHKQRRHKPDPTMFCGEVVHTAYARRDYYACKGRRTGRTCTTKYMGREKLESRLDSLFGAHLTSPQFLEHCVDELKWRHAQDDSAAHVQRLTAQVSSLREKRTRVVDAFLDGIIRREERDSRLAAVDRDILASQEILTRSNPVALVDLHALIQAFAPLVEWQYWSREQKRSVLATIVPDIRVADYQVAALGLSPTVFSNEDSRKAAGYFVAERSLTYLTLPTGTFSAITNLRVEL